MSLLISPLIRVFTVVLMVVIAYGSTSFLMTGIKAVAILETSPPVRVILRLSGLTVTSAFIILRSGAI